MLLTRVIFLAVLFNCLLAEDPRYVLSSPEQISILTSPIESLLGGVVSPMSGQLCLRSTDLVAKGAQNLYLNRFYVPPIIPGFTSHPEIVKYEISLYLHKNYKGWVTVPQDRLEFFKKGLHYAFRVTNHQAVTVEFKLVGDQIIFSSSPLGISNSSGDSVGAEYDLRNIQVTKDPDCFAITICYPDGTKAFYTKPFGHFLLLEKEILPNGKVVKYFHDDKGVLTQFDSMDPHERMTYASIQLDAGDYRTSAGLKAQYTRSQTFSHIDFQDKNFGSIQGIFWAPELLHSVSSPSYKNEKIGYNDRFQIVDVDSQKKLFSCSYQLVGDENEKHYRVNNLFYDGKLAYKFEYIPTVYSKSKKISGSTKVIDLEGNTTVYSYYWNFLPKTIHTYDAKGILKKWKSYQWNEKHYLAEIQVNDCDRLILCKKYEYDEFGNPILETIQSGDQSYFIRRVFSKEGQNLLLEEQKENGPLITYKYLAGTHLVTEKVTDKIVETFVYDEWNNLIESTKTDGHQITSTKRILRQQQPFLHMPEWVETYEGGHLLKKTHLSYDSYGNVCQEDVHDANQFLYSIVKTYNERGDLLSESNPLGQIATYSYDDKGRLEISSSFSNRLVEAYFYNPKGDLIEEKQNDQITQFKHDVYGNVIEQTDYLGRKTHYAYDLIVQRPRRIECGDRVTIHLYDAFGNEIETVYPRGNKTKRSYNAFGSPTQITYADGAQEFFEYTADNLLKSQTDLNGLTTTFEYDLFGRVLRKNYHDLASATFEYDSFNLVKTTDKIGYETLYSYNKAGRLESENEKGRLTEFSYDSVGRLSSKRVNDLEFRYHYDLLDRVIETLYLDDHEKILKRTAHSYDEDGLLESTTQGYLTLETKKYDAFGRPTLLIDGLRQCTTIFYEDKMNKKTTTFVSGRTLVESYDFYDQLIKKESVKNNKTLSLSEYFYDRCGNLLEQLDHVYEDGKFLHSQSMTYSYNKRNWVAEETRANLRTTKFGYTPSGQIASKTMPDQTLLEYKYDLFGNLTSLTSSDQTISHQFEYDLSDRLTFAKDGSTTLLRDYDPFGNVTKETLPQYIVEKKYDCQDRPLSLRIKDKYVEYSYDPLYLKSVKNGSLEHTYSYRVDGLPDFEILPFTLGLVQYAWDNKLRKISTTTPYFREDYRYDLEDNLISDGTKTFGYDDLSQLIEENNQRYTYDSLYNRHQKNDDIILTNALNEVLSQGELSISYDLNGNLIQKGFIKYEYDALNRLKKVMNEDSTIGFSYDPLGRLLQKTRHGQSLETYVYDGDHDIGTLDAQGKFRHFRTLGRYLHHDFPQVVGVELQNKLYIPLMDVQGNVVHLIDPLSRSLSHSYQLTFFGEELDDFCFIPFNPWRFASKRLDPDLNLVNFGKRFYDPEFARWLTLDPMGPLNSGNLYQYGLNNPLKFYDPKGESLFGFLIGIAEIIAGAAIMASGVAIEIATLGGYTFVFGFHEATGLALMTHGCSYSMQESRDLSWNRLSSSSSKVTDTYAPDRPLPHDEDGRHIPDTDAPHTQLGTGDGRKGNYPQAREFDKNGKPIRDIDFTDHGRPHNHTNPHQHEWKDNPTGGSKIRETEAQPLPGWIYK